MSVELVDWDCAWRIGVVNMDGKLGFGVEGCVEVDVDILQSRSGEVRSGLVSQGVDSRKNIRRFRRVRVGICMPSLTMQQSLMYSVEMNSRYVLRSV